MKKIIMQTILLLIFATVFNAQSSSTSIQTRADSIQIKIFFAGYKFYNSAKN